MIAWIEKHLIDTANEWWRMWSVRLMGLALMVDAMSLGSVLGLLPMNVRNLNPMLFDALQMVLVAAALVTRLFKQKKVTPSAPITAK